ncbi:MAG: alpha-ketoglutarate-dependent dioxygenase AlkB [Micrococcales bacterium]|nr:MAG: alpha-ketoglutarate-dependent dioxygenase AlkB [Micrococcales bacterium]
MRYQATLFGPSRPAVPALRPERTQLARGAWLDIAHGYLADADEVFDALVTHVPWRAERRVMWDREVDVPRLVYTYGSGQQLPHPALAAARDQLSEHYRAELGEPFVTAGCCFYRDGRDSVAWHGDTFGRGKSEDTMVAVVSVGDPRRLALRLRGGGASMSVTMGHGDLVVMGGSCQRTWEHAVPKVASAGPRISVQFRPRDVF